MKKITLLLVAILATTTMFAQLADVTFPGKAIAGEGTYITNNAQYPDPSFYAEPAGLKLNFEGQGILTPKFVAQNAVEVEIITNKLNSNTKKSKGGDTFTVTALNESGAEVASAGVSVSNAAGETVKVTLKGAGIVQVKVIMSSYPTDGTTSYNVNLKEVKVTATTATAVENVEADKLAAFVANDVLYVNAEEGATVRMYSVTGALVLNGIVNNGQVALNGLNNGIYVINVNNHVAKVTVR